MYRSGLVSTIICIFALAASSSAHATTWEIDPVHTSVQFSVRHMTISNVRGEFTKVSGKVLSEGTDPGRVKIEATIDASTIDTRETKRDKHLKSADFRVGRIVGDDTKPVVAVSHVSTIPGRFQGVLVPVCLRLGIDILIAPGPGVRTSRLTPTSSMPAAWNISRAVATMSSAILRSFSPNW